MKRVLPISVVVGAMAVVIGLGAVPANAADSNEPLAAVTQADPAAATAAAGVSTTSTGTNAIDTTVAGQDVTVPTDPSDGVALGAGANTVRIGLPFSDGADNATVEKAGVVSYDNNNGSTTVPVVKDDGSVQINTVINDANAPKRYDYPLALPEGQSLHLAADGSVYAADADGNQTIAVATPWAKDANGTAIPTHYEVNGNTLTQIVDFTSSTAFPVVADPSFYSYWWGNGVKFNKSETSSIGAASDYGVLMGGVCAKLKAVNAAIICGIVSTAYMIMAGNVFKDARSKGKCVQVNIPYYGAILGGPFTWSWNVVTC